MDYANHYRTGQTIEQVYHLGSYKGAQIRAEEAATEIGFKKLGARIKGMYEYADTINTIATIIDNPIYSSDVKKAAVFLVVASVMGYNIPTDAVIQNFDDAIAILKHYETELVDLAEKFPDLITYDPLTHITTMPWNIGNIPLSSFPPPSEHIPLSGTNLPSGENIEDQPRVLPSSNPSIATPFNLAKPLTSPLIIDLDNDGVEATAFNATTTTTFFDIDNDGFQEQTAWVGADDGLLVRDLNGNGQIDGASELFGSSTTDGFALLAFLDSNGDHVINASDTDFSDLMIWKDANGDAYVQNGELQSLSYWNIASISLAGVVASNGAVNGNPISHTSTVTLTSGATRAISDVWFVHDNANSYYNEDYELDFRTLLLPNLRGFGQLADLDIAMSLDENLLGMVQDLVSNWSMGDFAAEENFSDDVREILLKWADAEGITSNSRGSYVDAQHLAFLEAFMGDSFYQFGRDDPSSNPYPMAGRMLEAAWDNALNIMSGHIMIQAGAHELFDNNVSYNVWTGELEGDLDLSEDAIDGLVAFSTDIGVNTEAFWVNVIRFLDFTKGLGNLSVTEEGWLDIAIQNADPGLDLAHILGSYGTPAGLTLYGTAGNDTIIGSVYADNLTGGVGNDTLIGNAGDDILDGDGDDDALYGGDGDDTLYGDGGNDTLDGGSGGNKLYGGSGNDTYVYQGGYDYIEDSSGTDQINLGSAITPSDITFSRLNTTYGDLMIAIAGFGTIQISAFFSPYGLQVETLNFYDPLDGSINLTTLTNITTHGTDGNDNIQGVQSPSQLDDIIFGYGGNDYIEGKGGNDIIDGGLGNDTLYGDAGDDTYIASFGFDNITDASGNDVIVIPAAYSLSDVSFLRLAENSGKNLLISIQGLGQIKIYSQFQYYPVEKVIFANGIDSDITLSGISFDVVGTESGETLNGLTSMASIDEIFYGYGGNDYIYANTGDDILYGGDGNDILYGDDGNDHLYGGAGNDLMRGEAGDDTYYYESGVDTVYEWLYNSTNDRLVLPEGISPEDISLRYNSYGYDLYVSYEGQTIITIENQIDSSSAYFGIEYLEFYDATVWDMKLIAYEIHGTNSGETLYAKDMFFHTKDTLYGYGGNDTLYGNAGADILYGGDGLDTLYGGSGSDIFVFEAVSAFNNIDVIKDFSLTDDAIDISDLLSGYDPLSDILADWVEVSTSGTNTTLSIDRDGAGGTYSMVQIATIQGVTGLTDEVSLVTSGNLIIA